MGQGVPRIKVLLPYFNFHFLDDNAVHFICLLVSLKDGRGHAFPWRWLGRCYSSHSNDFNVVKILKKIQICHFLSYYYYKHYLKFLSTFNKCTGGTCPPVLPRGKKNIKIKVKLKKTHSHNRAGNITAFWPTMRLLVI